MSRDVDDVVQQTMLVFLENAEKFRAESSLLTFLIGIACNQMRAEKRPQAREAGTSLEDPQLEAHEPALHLLPEASDLGAAMAQLDADMQAVLRLLYWDDLSQAAIAKLLRIPRGTVASRLRRAKKDLRRHLEAELSSLAPSEKS
ncbi:MAG: sigma-70 family RNA polymerase sigma factor [Myxococcales bacterium]|nr:sigma-70 family RNA polymerase sigma factor [Myxococcales bacterium]